jgi:mono/diheme cytochrome c family protein
MIQRRFTQAALWAGAFALVALIGAMAVPATLVAQPAIDGKAVFTAQKCETCHAVSKAGIESKTKSGKMFGGDLSAAAAKLDPAKVIPFLKGETKDDKGEAHKKKATATDAELAALVAWLKTQAL